MAVTAGVALVCVYLYLRYRRPYFGIWALAWTLYVVRLAAIISFLVSERQTWLFVHQVLTGWTAVAFLWAAVSFSRPVRWRRAYLLLVAFPLAWSYVAIYQLDRFLFAAAPAVAFLAIATAWTALVFWRHHRRVGSRAAAIVAVGFLLWSAHHLDYPFLRARGAWNPWGYYIDILFSLWIGAAMLLLVLEDQHRGLSVLSGLSADLQGRENRGALLDALLSRPMTLPGVAGSAMYDFETGRFTEGLGACAGWAGAVGPEPTLAALRRMRTSHLPEVAAEGEGFALAVPVMRGDRLVGALVVLASARHPFAALDDRFLVALGHQVGAAVANAELRDGLEKRGQELERLAGRMVRQHEEERRRLYRELHDESAQVFAALKLQLGMLREEERGADREDLLDRAEMLVRTGIRSIRSAVRDLRPALLDDLGLVPALRGLAADFAEQSGLRVDAELAEVPDMPEEAELALYRCLQEGLSNVARHAGQVTRVSIRLRTRAECVVLEVGDDGRPAGDERGDAPGSGLFGMRERLLPMGGSVDLRHESDGTRLVVRLPLPGRAA